MVPLPVFHPLHRLLAQPATRKEQAQRTERLEEIEAFLADINADLDDEPAPANPVLAVRDTL